MFCEKCGTENNAQANFCRKCGNNLQGMAGTPAAQPAAVQVSYVFTALAPRFGPGGVEYAGFWKRYIAAVIDGVLVIIGISIVYLILLLIAVLGVFRGSRDSFAEVLFAVLVVLLIPGLYWLYFAGMESSPKQATIGKKIMGIIVTDLNGNRLSFGKASVRLFSKIISALVLNMGFLMIGFTEKKQGLHDMIAGCLVVVKK